MSSYQAPTKSYQAPVVKAVPQEAPVSSFRAPTKSYPAPVVKSVSYKAPAPAKGASYATPSVSYRAPAVSYRAPGGSYRAPSQAIKSVSYGAVKAASYVAPVPVPVAHAAPAAVHHAAPVVRLPAPLAPGASYAKPKPRHAFKGRKALKAARYRASQTVPGQRTY